jgi:integrase
MEEFRRLLVEIPEEPYRLMVLFAACLGLRMSELFGLVWGDFDLLRSEVHIQRGIVEGYVDETKTASSSSKLPPHPMIVTASMAWRQQSPFQSDTDYVFASLIMLGKKPLNANSAQRDYLRPASIKAGLQPIGFHALRHSLPHMARSNRNRGVRAEGTDATQHNRDDDGRLRSRHPRGESGGSLPTRG